MNVTYRTDEHLKSYLDTNQLHREQMCLAILSMDKRFSNVRHRHPRGGPDGGRDIEGLYRGEERAYGAVGFMNQASDVEERKKTIRSKFSDDLDSAWNAEPRPSVFVFFTNINFTIGDRETLVLQASAKGFSTCEIWDRERLRVALDSPDGFAARFQYLGIPMSNAEQASFFAKWGDDINSVISTGFQAVHSTLAHLLFLQEANRPINGLHVIFKLDKEYSAAEIGHFRAFCTLYLREPKLEIFGLLFGTTDKANRFREDLAEKHRDQAGIAFGVATGQWEVPWSTQPTMKDADGDEFTEREKYVSIGGGSGVGVKTVKQLVSSYTTPSFIRFNPVLSLADFDECMIMPVLNRSLASKIQHISIIANGYMLLDLPKEAFQIDNSAFELDLVDAFSDAELADAWVRIRPRTFDSNFTLSFSNLVPVRLFKSIQAKDPTKQ